MTDLIGYNTVYDIGSISEFSDLIGKDTNTLKLNKIVYTTKNNKEYKIIRYDKNYLSVDLIPVNGLLRSVIVNSANKVVGFSPPKMYSYESFVSKYSNTPDCIVAEEFVEGVMINVFWDSTIGLNGAWEIATRNTVGGESNFYKNIKLTYTSKTFRSMFLESAAAINLNINRLNPYFCYSFVMQHPNNSTVIPFKQSQLYLVEMYHILHSQDNKIYVYPVNVHPNMKSDSMWESINIKFPQIYEEYTLSANMSIQYKELKKKYASMNTPYNVSGVVIRNKITNDRCKLRNPNYEYIKQLRGHQPKLQYQYLCLRQEGKMHNFLTFYPEHKKEFSFFRDSLHAYTNTLYQNYTSCYIRKEKKLSDFSEQYRNHMLKIHRIYIDELKPLEQHVTNTVVINYVNKLHPRTQMYNLNYSMRKRYIDFIAMSSPPTKNIS
jgi:hypothetical protein